MKPCIVFVDDEAMNLAVFEAAMPDDWDIHVFDDPNTVIQELLEQKLNPWVVLSDQRMPGLKGVELLEAVKDTFVNAVRFIVTAYSEEDLVIESVRKAQIFDYIKKPWDPDNLVAAIERAIKFYQSEYERRHLVEKLQEAQVELTRLAAFPLQLPAIMFSIDQSGTIGYMNPFAQKTLKDLNLSQKTFEQILPINLKEIAQQCNESKEKINNLVTEYSGRFIMWAFSTTASGEVLCTGLDITDEVTAEKRAKSEEINRLAMEEIDRVKSMFFANMSHELRTPLNSIIGYSEIICGELENRQAKGEIDLEEKQYRYKEIKNIYQNGYHLLSLVNDILDMNKIEAGVLDIENTRTDINLVVENALRLVEPLAKKAKNELIVQCDSSLPWANADFKRVTQVLVNLVGNASKFTQQGKITITTRAQNQQVVIDVEDTGVGIKEEDQIKIFRRFSQVDDADQRGSGLGLHISQQLAHGMGGKISFTSEFGVGSKFSLYLPQYENIRKYSA